MVWFFEQSSEDLKIDGMQLGKKKIVLEEEHEPKDPCTTLQRGSVIKVCNFYLGIKPLG